MRRAVADERSVLAGRIWAAVAGDRQRSLWDLEALERELKSKHFAAFIVEPVQSEAGVCVPHSDYLRTAESLCRRYGTLFVLDEVQTGMYRTGPFLAAHHFGVEPDMVILAKAMSGGLVPLQRGADVRSDL